MHHWGSGLFALAVLAAARSVHADTAVPLVVGAAYDLSNQARLYSEIHCSSENAQTRDVIYRDTSDRLLASKTLNYHSGTTTPSYLQEDVYAGESTAVEVSRDRVEMTVTDAEGFASTITATVDEGLPLVVDAGFDAFVGEHWASLVAGERLRFQFPFAERDTLVHLRISAAACSYETAGDQCFLLELDNWALRLLVDPIELGYEVAQKRLVRYRGLSNIGDGTGAGQVVDIHYRYDNLPDMACDAEHLRRETDVTG